MVFEGLGCVGFVEGDGDRVVRREKAKAPSSLAVVRRMEEGDREMVERDLMLFWWIGKRVIQDRVDVSWILPIVVSQLKRLVLASSLGARPRLSGHSAI